MTACVENLDDWNVDQKKASAVPPRTLFTNALKGITDIVTTPNVNSNNFRMFVQYWATTTYLDEPRYNMTARTYSQSQWYAAYRDALNDLAEAKRLITEDELLDVDVKANQLALVEIMEVYCWNFLLNTFGDVPYTSALDSENLLPEYEDAATIFDDLLVRLDAAMGSIKPSAGTFTNGADVIYGGSASKWLLFGNSLKLKMGMLLADVNPSKSKTLVEQAAAGGVITTNDNVAAFPYISAPPNNNPISANLNKQFTSREDFVVASTIVDAMNERNDPRSQFYFTDENGLFIGGKYGFANTYGNFSHVSAKIIDPTFEGILIDASEVEFLLAEAVERGYSVGGSAEDHYKSAITLSMTYWGVEEGDSKAQKAVIAGIGDGGAGYSVGDTLRLSLGDPAIAAADPTKPVGVASDTTTVTVTTVDDDGAITAVDILDEGKYSIRPNTYTLTVTGGTGTKAELNVYYDGGYSTYLEDPKVAYATAAGNWKQKIGTQKWIALNNRGWESWVEWRRLDQPVLAPPSGPGVTGTLYIPKRMIYPVIEQTVNGDQWSAAAARFNSDSPDAPLFWDVIN